MKAYVITIPQSNRLVDGKIPNYPKCLPEPEVIIGFTADDGIKAPDWYIPHAKLNLSADTNWAIILGRIATLKKHLEKYPDEDCIIFEDDVYFCDDFDIVYKSFMQKVPDNWDMLYIGGHHKRNPLEIKPDILKCKSVIDNEFVIFRSTFIQTIIDLLQSGHWGLRNQVVDGIINSIVSDHYVYAPIPFFAGQLPGYSYHMQRHMDKGIQTDFSYVNNSGVVSSSSEEDYHRYKINNIKLYNNSVVSTDLASVSLFGTMYYVMCTLMFLKKEFPKLDMPLVIHSNRNNAELLDASVTQENIDVSNVYFQIHKDSTNLEGLLWRYAPNYSEFTHIFDVDMHIAKLHKEAIDDYKDQDVDWYTCRHLEEHWTVCGCMLGIRSSLLPALYPLLYITAKKRCYAYMTDEEGLTTFLPILSSKSITYKNKINKQAVITDKECPKNYDEIHPWYMPVDFNELKNYSNGKYTIEGKEYKVNEKGK